MKWKYVFLPVFILTQVVVLNIFFGVLELSSYVESVGYYETECYFHEKLIDIDSFLIFDFAKIYGYAIVEGVEQNVVINYPPKPVWSSFSSLGGIVWWTDDFVNGSFCKLDLDNFNYNRYIATTADPKLVVTIVSFSIGVLWMAIVISILTGWIFYKKNKVIRMDNL